MNASGTYNNYSGNSFTRLRVTGHSGVLKRLTRWMTLCLILTGYVSDGLAQTVQELEPYAQQIPGTGVEIEMVPVEGGAFMMGSRSEEHTSELQSRGHRVC